jgi:uncharacterized surface protein with fasciclin (FAS1) repeats
MRQLPVMALCLALAACGGDTGGSGNGADPLGNTAAGPANGTAGAAAPAGGSLLASLTGAPDHKTLAAAVKAAGLEKTLSGAQPYTIFAPTEAAFGKLPAGAVEGLLSAEQKGQLTAVLTGHIVPGTVTAQDLVKAVERGKGKAQLATVGGTTLSFAQEGGALILTGLKGGQVRVVAPDQAASNGVIHGIDGVLMPQ